MAQPLSTIHLRHRLAQLLVLIVIIIAGILFSEVAQASRPRHKNRVEKPKYWNTVHSNSNKACYLLHKKRTKMPRHPLISFSRRAKYRPMAETDPSSRLASSK